MSTPADELRAAAAVLRAQPRSSAPLSTGREDGEWADRHTLAGCTAPHDKSVRLDSNGHCGDCEFAYGYDQDFMAGLAALHRAIEPLADLLDEVAAAWPRHAPHTTTLPASRTRTRVLAVARQINGGAW